MKTADQNFEDNVTDDNKFITVIKNRNGRFFPFQEFEGLKISDLVIRLREAKEKHKKVTEEVQLSKKELEKFQLTSKLELHSDEADRIVKIYDDLQNHGLDPDLTFYEISDIEGELQRRFEILKTDKIVVRLPDTGAEINLSLEEESIKIREEDNADVPVP